MTPPLTDAERETVEANLNLIWFFVNRIGHGSDEDERDEMFADGIFGLMRAAQLFDPERGYAFSTYASAWIRSRIGKGRETRRGGNFRRSKSYGEEFSCVSLDALQSEWNETFPMLIADAFDVEGEALAVEQLRDAVSKVRETCDPIDMDILDGIMAGDLVTGLIKDANRRVAERHGRTVRGVSYRREALNQRLREAMA